ncbi:hypothetical protein CIHG_00273 [Coccidioides immitis H538.4]|uniref:Uncharacterized protein n=1 Tax=Coccidioides immitis H538.4 TaxID=396776 RepID=A0A0J8RD74_COCIT|nr:hypothetical protein CIHG_00273 [Coccidioides immitis H538.4]
MPYLLMMPSPGIPHRPSNRGSAKNPASKPKRLDLGDPLGPYDTNTVREKVRKWQQQGGGVVIAPDVGASDDGDGDGDGEGDRSSKESGLAARQKRKDRSGQEGAGKQRMREPEEGEKQKISNRTIGTAPKKRVVSDGHWRKDRIPAESPSPTKRTSRKHPDACNRYEETKEKFEKRTEKYGKPTSGDGIKVYAGPLREPKSPGARRSDGSERSNSSTDHKNKYHGRDTKKSPSRHRSTRREVKAKYIVNDFPYKSDHSKPNESSEAASLSGKENRAATPKTKTPPRYMKSTKGGFINQVVGEPKKKFSKKDLPPVQQSHGSKVEAWLSRTSDPFVSDHEPYVEIPAPLKSSPRRSDSGNEKDSDPNRHSRLEGHRSSTKRKSRTLHRHQERFSGTDEDDHQKEPSSTRNDRTESSPPNLKRSKASRRPESMENRRMSMLHESIEEAIQASAVFDRPVSSDGSEGSSAERPPPLTLRRLFPGTGMHRLSTIASVDALDTATEPSGEPTKNMNKLPAALEHDDVSESETRDQFDPNSIPGPGARSLKRKLTTHSDLMSVLSLPAGGSRSIRSARSIRTNRSRLATATVGDIMRELASDEGKYMRELRTLVGGVIPVLLTSVLSKADSAVAAGLFRPSAKPTDEDSFTRPIVNMGVSLEKLKSIHKRIPLEDPEALLAWAQGAQKVYADYLSAWRLGFQDVVVDSAGRWLLFPPIDHGRVSARNGDSKGEIVIMVRGVPEEGGNWYELLALKTEDEQIGFEWVQMLGLSPVPPKINRSMSFVNRAKQKKVHPQIDLKRSESVVSTRSIIPSPTDIGVPIGENALRFKSQIEDDRAANAALQVSRDSTSLESSRNASTVQKTAGYDPRTPPALDTVVRTPRCLNEAMEMAGGASPTTLKRSKAKRRSKYGPLSPSSPISSEDARTPEQDVKPAIASPEPEPQARKRNSELLARSVSPELKDFRAMRRAEKGQRPIAEVTRLGRRSVSPVPSLDLPSIPRLRKRTPIETPPSPPVHAADSSPVSSRPKTPKKRDESAEEPFLRSESNDHPIYTEDVPVPPPHRSPSPSRSKQSSLSAATPTFSPWARHRRTSSPLKHEYEPSTATESTESTTSTVERYTIDSSSETSDEELEGNDIVTPLPPINAQRVNKVSPPPSAPTLPEETLSPSNSPSQAPYKTVPSQPSKASKTIASIYYWHDKGSWEALHTDECSIVVTPGLIEAYEMGPAHSQPIPESSEDSPESDKGVPQGRPLIALELTPLVPIRRGTALDISIRSPPTSKSKLRFSGNNIMFRSRSPDECDQLYNLINQSRINNPTYIALQNASGPYSNQPAPLSRYNSTRSSKGGGWFSWYGGSSKSSYRATSAPAPSVAGVTESSVGTMASAFSALKRFGAGSKMFSIAKSTLTSRTGSRGGSLYSTSTRSGSNSFPAGPPNGKGQEQSKLAAGGIGLTNTKIRLYCRESASKWRDMGAARLTILPASPAASPPGTSYKSARDSSGALENETGADGATATSPPASAALHTATLPSRQHEKRILIHGKAYGQVLLDVCLGESCFERVARTGIAVSVWEDFQGVAKEGGVVGGSFKIYMIQMKSEAETAYTFGLVGKLRY